MKSIALSLLALTLLAEDPKPTVEQLQQQIVQLKADLAEARARSKVGWDYLNVCLERAVIAEKPKPTQ